MLNRNTMLSTEFKEEGKDSFQCTSLEKLLALSHRWGPENLSKRNLLSQDSNIDSTSCCIKKTSPCLAAKFPLPLSFFIRLHASQKRLLAYPAALHALDSASLGNLGFQTVSAALGTQDQSPATKPSG